MAYDKKACRTAWMRRPRVMVGMNVALNMVAIEVPAGRPPCKMVAPPC